MLAAFRVGAHGNDGGRPQNGTASTGKLNYSNVRCREASNQVHNDPDSQGGQAGVYVGNCAYGKQRRTKTREKKTAEKEVT
jgi:hypothetical protein